MMHQRIIKPIANYIANPITHIFNASVDEGVFPSLLKIGKVIPVYKKDDPLNISNYRPISLLPIISKIFEQLILIKLNKFNIITNSQHGFRETIPPPALHLIFSTKFTLNSKRDHLRWDCLLTSQKRLNFSRPQNTTQ
jgi:hypothetical protein